MRAVLLNRHGGPEALHIGELADSPGSPAQVLVAMTASALNHLDIVVRQGLTGPGVRGPGSFPHVMGAEGSGVIAELGPQAQTSLAVGDRVMVFPGLSCGECRHCRRGQTSRCAHYKILGEDVWGVQRERVWLDPRNLLPVPSDLTMLEAAAIPIAYTTAWTMLQTAGQLRVGERVLVMGASGGVAVAAIQIAVQSGAEVWATTRGTAKREAISALPGVHSVIDSNSPGWSRQVLEVTGGLGMDLIINPIGGSLWHDSVRSLATGGRMMLCGATGGDDVQISIREIYQAHRQIIGAPLGGWDDFISAVNMLDKSKIRPLLHTVMPMEEAATAHRILEGSEHVGKIVLTIE